MTRDIHDILREADQLYENGKYDDALKLYDQIIGADDIHMVDAMFGKAECLQSLEKHYEAIKWYDKAIELDEENPLPWNGKGVSLFEIEDYNKAIIAFSVAFDLDPSNLTYLLSQAEMILLNDEYAEGLKIARESLEKATETADIILSWILCIYAQLLLDRIVNALSTLDEFISYLKNIEEDLIPDNDYMGTNYDFTGLAHLVDEHLYGATKTIAASLLSYLRKEINSIQLAKIVEENIGKVAESDLSVPEEKDKTIPEEITEFPDLEQIADPKEKQCLEILDGLIEGYDDNIGFQSFRHLFSLYDWKLDRGPAPFILELGNRFFVEIDNGQVRRLALDVEALNDVIEERMREKNLGELLYLPNLEELYLSARSLMNIISILRDARFKKGSEILVFINVDKTLDQENLLALENAPEAWEIDEIPVDYQEEGEKLVGSFKWVIS